MWLSRFTIRGGRLFNNKTSNSNKFKSFMAEREAGNGLVQIDGIVWEP
jgi:hypothetical protein